MFVAIIVAVVGLPLIGLLLMEAGAFGPDILAFGSYNGVSIAYSIHLAVFFTTWAVVRALSRRRHPHPFDSIAIVAYSRSRFRRLAIAVSVAIAAYTLFLLFGAGAWRVVTGAVAKGDFRGSFGGLGPLIYLARDFLIPVSSSLVAFVYRRCNPAAHETVLLSICLALTGLSTLVWGYKAGAIITLLPAMVLLFPTVRFHYLAIAGVISMALLVISTVLLERVSPTIALLTLGTRATLGTANSAWKIWDLQTSHVRFPEYLPTLTSALGGRVASALGFVSRDDLARFQTLDFGSMLTNVVKDYAPGVNSNTTSVTGTVFSEGVIALGSRGFVLFSVLAGLVVGLNGHFLRLSQTQGRPLIAAVAAVFVTASCFSWLNAGGLVALVNLPYVFFYPAAYFAGSVLLSIAGIRKRPAVETPA